MKLKIHKKWKWIAQDEDGTWWIFEKRPKLWSTGDSWDTLKGEAVPILGEIIKVPTFLQGISWKLACCRIKDL